MLRRARDIAIGCCVALLVAGCAMPPQMKIETARDPRYEDQDVRFRTTYYLNP